MARLRKLRKAQKFRYNVNRKRVNKKQNSVGAIKSTEIKNAWNNKRTVSRNLNDMGLGYDSNKIIRIPTAKQTRMQQIKMINGFIEEDIDAPKQQWIRPKDFVAKQMEADANELQESGFKLPKGVVAFATYLLDTYKLNYNEMVKDEKNYDQETWRQFRAKIRKFTSIPEQFDKYVESRNLDVDKLDWIEYSTDDE